ncbi:hypothetical protein P0R31_37070 [Bradyrhizobium yuanmingense]|uniref:hypothetical protein n=1 Tax=Bradyrhizobium yuanmingense TaxID=108015 RepID=UPI0023B97181|nr:hypothetical protein [Bradyrhizobium yuanmingense]MDF0522851.1 hypothetical protein [Bradyrhizobium yuanmingense]
MADEDDPGSVTVINLDQTTNFHTASFPHGGQVLVMSLHPGAAIRIGDQTLNEPGDVPMPPRMNVPITLFRVKEITQYSASLRIETFAG